MAPIKTYTDSDLGSHFNLQCETEINNKQKINTGVFILNPISTFIYSSSTSFEHTTVESKSFDMNINFRDFSSTFSLLNIERITNRPVQIRYPSDEVLRIKKRNNNYDYLINFIVYNIEKLEILSELSYIIKIYIYKDIELPTWKQTVISISVPELSIKEKLGLWKLIVNKVYSIIKTKKNKKLYAELKKISIEFK